MKRTFFVLSFILALIGCKDKEDKTGVIQVVSPQEMQTLLELDDVQLVDVRTPEEYKEGHVESFQNIDYFSPDFDIEIEKLDKTKPVIVYCRTGNRSGKCAEKMKEKGFVKIYDLKGGFSRWKHEGFEFESGL